MKPNTVLVKTGKGQDEIATRQNRLPARVRTMLITVDGRRSVQELAASSVFGEAGAHECLATLLDNGYVAEVVGVSAAPITMPPASAASEGEAKDVRGIKQGVVNATPYAQQVAGDIAVARRYVAQSVYEIFGPDVDMFALSIESAKTSQELLQQMDRMRTALVASVGEKRVEELWAKTHLLLA